MAVQWHWLRRPDGERVPFRWLPHERLWRCGNQQISAEQADRLGWSYWAPGHACPSKPYRPSGDLPLFREGA
jgi:hypothetical protein